MRRSVSLALVSAALMLLASLAQAQQNYTMSGKYGRKVGAVINIPLGGSTTCLSMGHGANLQALPTGPMGQLTMTPLPVSIPFIPINPNGCILGYSGTAIPGGTLMGAPVQGANPATFTVPVDAFKKAQPGVLNVVPVPVPVVQQLATSWGIRGPKTSPTAMAPLNGTMATGANTAQWRRFKKDAWMTQTGRIGPNFTVCWGFQNLTTPTSTVPSPFGPCGNINAGSRPMLVKYTGAGSLNRFGGTMGLVLTVGANTGSVALNNQPWFPQPTMNIGFQPLAGSGSAVGGRGYNVTRAGGGGAMGSVFASFMTSTGGGNGLVTTVMNFIFPLTAAAANTAHLPFTTGTILARNTGTQLGNPNIVTFTAMGNDARTTMGAGNITLVAGGMNSSASGSNAPSVDIMQLSFVPEPGAFLMLVAGGLFLVGADRVRSRRR